MWCSSWGSWALTYLGGAGGRGCAVKRLWSRQPWRAWRLQTGALAAPSYAWAPHTPCDARSRTSAA
jgi:hypothetical protein